MWQDKCGLQLQGIYSCPCWIRSRDQKLVSCYVFMAELYILDCSFIPHIQWPVHYILLPPTGCISITSRSLMRATNLEIDYKIIKGLISILLTQISALQQYHKHYCYNFYVCLPMPCLNQYEVAWIVEYLNVEQDVLSIAYTFLYLA